MHPHSNDTLVLSFSPFPRSRFTALQERSLHFGPHDTQERRIVSYRFSYRCVELCLFEALYPAPLERSFSILMRRTATALPTDPITPIELASTLSSNQGGAARPGANLEPIHTKQKTPAIKTGAFACHSKISKTIRTDSRPGYTTGSTGYHCPSDSDSRRPKSMFCFLLLRRGERGRHFHRCRRRRYPLHHRG